MGICRKTNMTAKQGILTDQRYERTNMAYKCRILEAGNFTLHGNYTCVYSFQSFWHKYRIQNMSDKPGIHRWSLMIKNK